MTAREYEAMFLLDNQAATADFEATAAQVDAILEKHGAQIVVKEKWDERKLAYEIKGHRRATYYLVYFQAPPPSITEIDQDVHLNEVILRHLVIALDEPIDQHIEHRAADREKMAEESRRASLSGWGDRRGRERERKRKTEDKPAEGAEKESDEAEPSEDAPAGTKEPVEEPVAAAREQASAPTETENNG